MLARPDDSTLWTLTKAGRSVTCVVRLLRIGIDVSVRWDGEERVGRAFSTAEEAHAWAEDERQDYLARGWIDAPAHHGSARATSLH